MVTRHRLVSKWSIAQGNGLAMVAASARWDFRSLLAFVAFAVIRIGRSLRMDAADHVAGHGVWTVVTMGHADHRWRRLEAGQMSARRSRPPARLSRHRFLSSVMTPSQNLAPSSPRAQPQTQHVFATVDIDGHGDIDGPVHHHMIGYGTLTTIASK